LVGVAAAVSWARILPRINGIDVLAVTAVLGGGYPVFREALENLIARRMTMELSMTIALAAALAIREFSTALFILFFVLGAEILEGLTVDRGRKAIQNLLGLLPKKALIRGNGGFEEVAIDCVRPGQIVVIRPAAEIPVDGVVALGHSTVDQSSITGESKPVEKIAGSTVFAGTTNHSGMLEVRTTSYSTRQSRPTSAAIRYLAESSTPWRRRNIRERRFRNWRIGSPAGWCTSPSPRR
jgi:cation transport ATPase